MLRKTKSIKTEDIFVGIKGTMSYVLAIETQFTSGKKKVTVKARGKTISTAIDAVQIYKHKFMPELKILSVEIGTEQVVREYDTNEKANVSTITIVLSRGEQDVKTK